MKTSTLKNVITHIVEEEIDRLSKTLDAQIEEGYEFSKDMLVMSDMRDEFENYQQLKYLSNYGKDVLEMLEKMGADEERLDELDDILNSLYDVANAAQIDLDPEEFGI
jgi:hypothetical protein